MARKRQADDGQRNCRNQGSIDMLVTLLDHAITQGAILKLPKFVRLVTMARNELVEDQLELKLPRSDNEQPLRGAAQRPEPQDPTPNPEGCWQEKRSKS